MTDALVVGCAGVRSEAPKEQEQGRAEATEGQARSPEAPASEEDRCEGTQTFDVLKKQGIEKICDSSVKPGDPEALYTTNDVPGCPNGGLLSGTDRSKNVLHGQAGGDELTGQRGDDVLHGGAGDDKGLWGVGGEDVIYGGDGNDFLYGIFDGGERDELYCGKGNDEYDADKNDYVDSSCEVKAHP